MSTHQLANERSARLTRLRDRDAQALFLHNVRELMVRAEALVASDGGADDRTPRTTDGASERLRFLSSLSHGLRTPLHNIFGYAQLLEAGIRGPLTEQQLTDISRIRENERDLVTLVDAVMDFAQWYDEELPPLQDVVLRDALRDARRQIAAAARLKGVVCTSGLKDIPAGVMVRAEPRRLTEILRHLLVNAVKFSRPGAMISVRAVRTGDRVAIEIVDTGIGVHGADLELIFHPFVRGRGAYVRAQEGVGLGLAIARTLSRSIGGALSVTSRHGKGSTFTLELRSASRRPRAPSIGPRHEKRA